jgi:phosphoribosylformylglycinamidine cyclo-ligase
MPEFYAPGEYDLGGFAVGLVDPKRALPRKDIRPGDALIGLRSSGTHSNGYSLLRRLVAPGPEGDERARELLTPTRIYAAALGPLLRKGAFKGLAHITGSGFLNVPRMSEKVSYEIEMPARAELPGIYDWIRRVSGASESELYTTFNMGIGIVAVTSERTCDSVLRALKRSGEKAWRIGRVVKRSGGKTQVRIREAGSQGGVELDY